MDTMNIWVLTRTKAYRSADLLVEAGKSKGVTVSKIFTDDLQFEISEADPSKLIAEYGRPDICHLRVGSISDASHFALASQLSSLGIRSTNNPDTMLMLRDKAVSLAKLSAAKVPIPKTLAMPAKYDLSKIYESLGESGPWVLKSRFGAYGEGVLLVESKRGLRSALDTLLAKSEQTLLQEFIDKRIGKDIRVLVIGDKAVAAMERSSGDGKDFRSNMALGGASKKVKLTDELSSLAVAATKATGLTIAGVDILGEPGGYVVTEVNMSPGLMGISEASGVDVASLVIDQLME